MKKKYDVFDVQLDKEEQELSDALDMAIETGTLESISNMEQHLSDAREAAAQYLKKDARINIRISSQDLTLLKKKAAHKGLPYQTFIASVLHQYAADQFGSN